MKGVSFSPDGQSVVFVGRDPGSDGSDAPQIFMLDVGSGARHVTAFTSASVGVAPDGVAVDGIFLAEDLPGGCVYDSMVGGRLFTVRPDGIGFRRFELPGFGPDDGDAVHVELPGPIAYSAPTP